MTIAPLFCLTIFSSGFFGGESGTVQSDMGEDMPYIAICRMMTLNATRLPQ